MESYTIPHTHTQNTSDYLMPNKSIERCERFKFSSTIFKIYVSLLSPHNKSCMLRLKIQLIHLHFYVYYVVNIVNILRSFKWKIRILFMCKMYVECLWLFWWFS